jgi:hypothetical protein
MREWCQVRYLTSLVQRLVARYTDPEPSWARILRAKAGL